MKHVVTLLLLVLCLKGFSQSVPQTINYQGAIRSANGSPVVNKAIGIQFRILQGSSSGLQVFIESQSLNTNALGLFSARIGTVSSLSNISWGSGTYFLEVSVDTTGGSAYVLLGTQQMVSVPYALYAGSAPSPTLNISNNVLSVGSNTVGLPSSAGSISITGSGATTVTTLGLNSYDINTPAPVSVSSTYTTPTQAFGLAQVIGTYPNYSVMVAPVISYSPSVGTLSLSSIPFSTPSYNYTYNITPDLNLSGNVLSVGPPSNSVTLPPSSSVSGASVVSGGGIITTTLAPNSFSLSAVVPTFTGAGSSTVTGTFPNYTISTPPAMVSASVYGAGSASVSGGPSYTVTTPITPTVYGAGSASVSGGPSYTVTTPITPTVYGAGSASVTGGPSYTITTPITPSVSVVANPTAGLAYVSGAYPNYTITVAPTFSYMNSTGSLVVTNPFIPGLSYSANVTPSLTFSNNVLWSGPTSNSVSLPAAVTPTITGAGVASVSASANNFTVSVPVTTLTSSGTGLAAITNTAPNVFDINVPATNLNSGSNATVSGTFPNYTVSALPPTSITTSGTGSAVVTSTATNSFNLSVPAVTLTASGGGATMGGIYPNLSITAPSVAITPSYALLGTTGLLQKAGTYPNYVLYVAPNITYDQNTGLLHLDSYPFTTPAYGYTAAITPSITISNNVITNGPSTNSVAVTSPPAIIFTNNLNGLTLLATTSYAQLNTGTMTFTKQVASSEVDVYLHCEASTGVLVGASRVAFELRIDNNNSTISSVHYLTSGTGYITLRAVFQGLSAGSHTVSVWAKTNTGTALAVQLDPNALEGKVIVKETY